MYGEDLIYRLSYALYWVSNRNLGLFGAKKQK